MQQIKFKLELKRVNLSSVFVTRARCKMCSRYPSIYYWTRLPVLWFDPRRVVKIHDQCKKYWTRMCSDFYLNDSPSSFDKIAYFSFNLRDAGGSYNPKLHYTKGVHPVFREVEFLTCKCGNTAWAFDDNQARYRMEIVSRKARYKYPYRFSI